MPGGIPGRTTIGVFTLQRGVVYASPCTISEKKGSTQKVFFSLLWWFSLVFQALGTFFFHLKVFFSL